MAKIDVLDILRTKKSDPMSFHFDTLWIPPMQFYLSPQDVDELRKIATSAKLSSKINQKYRMIDDIMQARGFKRFSAGTNRVVYRCLEDTRFLVKIAVDKVGMQDNPLEYKNQFLLQPFITKMFYVSPCGTVGFSERVLPVKNKEEFKQIASDVFDILVNKILGLYVVEDVGTKYFMNWGIRPGFGPVLLDYPYVYNLDGDKLFCNWTNPITGEVCNGEIDYDAGFNHLVCTRCGKSYLATNLRDESTDNKIVIKKGGFQMRVLLKKGDHIISEPIPVDDVMVKPVKKSNKKTKLVVGIKRPDSDVEIVNSNINEAKVLETETKPVVAEVVDTTPVVPKTWSPEVESNEDESTIEQNDGIDSEIDESECTPEEEVATDVIESDANDTTDEDNNYTDDSDDEDDDDDIVLASDINLNRHHRPKNSYIAPEYNMGKNKKKKNGMKSNFIPQQ